MTPGFQNKTLAVTTQDGLNFTLLEPLFYLDTDNTWYACPQGSTSDGISTPSILHVTEPPYGPDRWFSGIIHDCSPKYRCTLLVWTGERWTTCTLTFEQCNALIRRALISQGFNAIRADAYFEALQVAGSSASVNDLSGAIGHLVMPPRPPGV